MTSLKEKEIDHLVQTLVQMPSITEDLEECKRVVDFAASFFESTPLTVQRFESNGHFSILISQHDTLEYDLLLCGHLDVVSAPTESFIPEVKDGKLHGRGSADMKGSCAVMMSFMRDQGMNPKYEKLGLLLSSDEEAGGQDGVGYLVNSLGLKAKVAFIPDGGEAFTPCIFEKGGLDLRLHCKGKPAHGARPWNGINAIELLYDDLRAIKDELNEASLEDEWQNSVNIGQIEGGVSVNSVPEQASALVDIRLSANTTTHEALERVKKSIQHSTLELRFSGEPVVVDTETPEFKLFTNVLHHHGFSSAPIREHGASDAVWFASQGTVILLILPLCSKFHVADEWVELSSLYQMYEVLSDFAWHLLGNESECKFTERE